MIISFWNLDIRDYFTRFTLKISTVEVELLPCSSGAIWSGRIQGDEGVANSLLISFCGKVFCQGSLIYPFWGDQTMQISGDFEGFTLVVHCLGW